MEKRQLRIDVLGASFVIQSDESTEHLNRLSAFVKARVEDVRKRYPFAEPLTVAVLAALNIADEMFKIREGHEPAELSEIDSVAERLIRRIDDDLLTHTPLAMDGEGEQGQGGPKASPLAMDGEGEPRAAAGSQSETAGAQGQGGPKASAGTRESEPPEEGEEPPQS